MKKLIITLAAGLFIGQIVFADDDTSGKKWYRNESSPGPGFSQELTFEVHGRYERPVKKEKLSHARFLSDFIDGYPTTWISNYISVEISATCNGKPVKARRPDYTLSAEQKNMLNSADLGTELAINVKYNYKNPANDVMDLHEMNVSMMVIPETEAEYVGGYRQLRTYLKENVMNKISETIPIQFRQGKVIFTVNEKGAIGQVRIAESSGDPKADKLMVDAIRKMPAWKPAQNSKGIHVKQEFEFRIGSRGC